MCCRRMGRICSFGRGDIANEPHRAYACNAQQQQQQQQQQEE